MCLSHLYRQADNGSLPLQADYVQFATSRQSSFPHTQQAEVLSMDGRCGIETLPVIFNRQHQPVAFHLQRNSQTRRTGVFYRVGDCLLRHTIKDLFDILLYRREAGGNPQLELDSSMGCRLFGELADGFRKA